MRILLIKDLNIYKDKMNSLYLTDNIFIKSKKLYYEDGDKIQEVKNHNWHRLLEEYGWEKLNKNWIKIDSSYMTYFLLD